MINSGSDRINHLSHDPTSLQQLGFNKVLDALAEQLATPFGRDKLQELDFSSDIGQIRGWLDEASEMAGLLNAGYHVPIGGFSDIRPELHKSRPENAYLEPEALLDIKSYLQMCGELSHFFREKRAEAPLAARYADHMHYHRNIAREIEATIDPSGEILDNASPALRKTRIKIRSLEGDNKRALQKAQKIYGDFSQDEIVTLRDGRMVLGIVPSFVNKVSGIVHGTSSSGNTVFVEPMETLKISNEIQNLRLQERNEIIKILRFLTGLVREIRDDIAFGLENLAILDLILARARFAVKLDASAPKISTTSKLMLKDARHPLLLLKMPHEEVVPLSLTLGEDFSTLVITGPNAGGKTVSMKTVGLLILMTRMGMLIPAHPDSEIPLLNQIMVDIGDRQSLENDLSTFSAHVVRLRDILEHSDEHSLVLLDEAGTGTDPREGAALAIAVLSELTERNILTIATTHHGELKAFAHDNASVENSSMEFDLKTLLPTYNLRVGVPGSSYAFEISRRYGLPDSLIDKARERVGQERNRLEDLILSLEEKLQSQDKERRDLSIKLSKAEAMTTLYETQVESLKKNKKELQRKAALEAEQVLKNANALIERSVQDIRASGGSKTSIKAAREALEAKKNEVDKLIAVEKPAAPDNRSLKKGDVVFIESLKEEGELLDNVGEKKQVRVLVNHIKMKLDVANLRGLKKAKPKTKVIKQRKGSDIDKPLSGVGMELDVRGLYPEQAIEETNLYLAEAVSSGWKEVRIVHGKGTGALRTEINQYLSRDKRVESRRMGKYGEGDSGVTVVTLRE